MRTLWLDGGRLREVDVTPLGGSRFRVTVDGAALELEVEALGGGAYRFLKDGLATPGRVTTAGARRFVRIGTLDFVLERAAAGATSRSRAQATGGLESPMPGLVTRVMVQVGESVKKGQPLVAVEAMKMEHVLRSPRDGKVRTLSAAMGAMVSPGVPLVELEE